MIKNKLFFKVFSATSLMLVTFLLAGCSLTGKTDGGIYKSVDGGLTFEQKVVINEEDSIARADILDIEIDPDKEGVIYVGTERMGILRTTNGGESWARDLNDFSQVRAIKKVPGTQKIYIATKKGARGKVLKTEDGGDTWTEIYTEKTDGSIVGTIAYDYNNPDILYIGTSSGGIFKTEDGGETWKTLLWAESGVRTIVIDRLNTSVIYFGTMSSGALISRNAGKDFTGIGASGEIFNIVVHPSREGFVYLNSEEGLLRSDDYGDNWEVLNTLVKPKEIASKGLAVNPSKGNEVFYTSGRAFYKSIDSGETWQPIQFDISRSIREIEVDIHNSDVLYLGTAKEAPPFGLPLN